MNALAEHVTIPLRRGLGELCYRVDFSVMEVLYVLAVLLSLGYLTWSITAVVRAAGGNGPTVRSWEPSAAV